MHQGYADGIYLVMIKHVFSLFHRHAFPGIRPLPNLP